MMTSMLIVSSVSVSNDDRCCGQWPAPLIMKKGTRKSLSQGSGNIFIDLGFEPHEAAVMLLRCELAEALRKWIDRDGLTQEEAARLWGIAPPRLSQIARNKVDKLSLEYLVGLCAKAGVVVIVKTAA